MLGFYRILLALGVLIGHVGNTVSDGVTRVMVGCFFIISGYLMAMTLTKNYKRNPLPFYWNRFLRVYPLHSLVLVMVLILAPRFVQEKLEGASDQTLALFQSFAIWPPFAGALNGPAWTLYYEIIFYVIAPFFFYLGLPGAVLLGSVGMAYLIANGVTPWVVCYPFALGYGGDAALFASFILFAAGSLAFYLKNDFNLKLSSHVQHVGLLCILLIIICGSRLFQPNGPAFDQEYGFVLGLFAYSSTILFLTSWQHKESSKSKLAGELCYPLYIIHWPLVHLVVNDSPIIRKVARWANFCPLGEPLMLITITAALTLGISYFWLCLEARIITRRRAPHSSGNSAVPRIN